MVALSSFVCSFPCVGFSGSRLWGSPAVASCRAFLPSLASFSGLVGVGCASGVDALVRSAFPSSGSGQRPSALVFSVSLFLVGGRVTRAAFAARSARLVHWVAASGSLLVAFPAAVCPAGVAPSVSFRGFGSGTWGSVALALGLGVPVLVVVPAAFASVTSAGSVQVFPAPPAVAVHFVFAGAAPCGGSLWLTSAKLSTGAV